MSLIDTVHVPTLVKREPKRMIERSTLADGRTLVAINFSSLALLQDCMRKGYYAFNRGLVQTTEPEATRFGTAVHKALEVWYCAPRESRRKPTRYCDDYQDFMVGAQEPPAETQHGACVRCAAVATFLAQAESLRYLPDTDKRSLQMGARILNAYFDYYIDDPYRVDVDALGPVCERQFESQMWADDSLVINYHGQIDVVLRNELTGELVVTDHKTSSSLGQEFQQRVRPNHQYTGYLWGARASLGLTTNSFMVNGIAVLKTKTDFLRQVTRRDEADFSELQAAVRDTVQRWLVATATDVWPQTAPGPCSMWGGCTYRALCEAPADLRPVLERNLYSDRTTLSDQPTPELLQ